LIEFKEVPDDIHGFTETLDQALKELNSDYEAKRYLNLTIAMPTIHLAPKGLFYEWLKKNDKLGGQHKVPRLSNKRSYLEELLQIGHSEAG
jgi:hypothetical protein